MSSPPKHVIFNADDFGASSGVNRGIIEAHVRGVVTSTSLLVTGGALEEAVALSRTHPDLAVGLHWDVWGEDERDFDLGDHRAVRTEFARQLTVFRDIMGRVPTHVDSHKHAHLEDDVREMFRALVEPLGMPLRGDGRISFVGGFYAQWEWGVTTLDYVKLSFLEQILRTEISPGWTELSCHPGYRSPDYESVYLDERETELRTLTDPDLLTVLAEVGITLSSFADWPGL